jgi:hypothetical protein
MKTSPSDSDPNWEKLLRQARADVGPPADVPALLRAVRHAPPATRTGWAADFSALFATSRVITSCLAGASAFALVATWHVWDSWQALPWAQLLDTTVGGGS